MTKKILSVALALLLMVTCFSGVIASADEAETPSGTSYDAVLGFADGDLSSQNWAQTISVTGAGEYSLTWTLTEEDSEASGATVFVIDIKNANADFAAAGLKLTALSVLMDGKELAVDFTKVQSGDLEEKGNFRIEIFNEYGPTKDNAPIARDDVAFSESLTINFKLEASGETTAYTAALGLVASDWSTNTDFRENSNTKIEVGESGTYTIVYEGACADLGILVVDILGAQAAMDAENKTWQVSDVALTVDGNAVAVDESKIICGDLENNGAFRIEVQNMYGSTKDDPAIDATTAVTERLSLTFTLTVVEKKQEVAGGELPDEFTAFIAYGGDKTETGWDYEYYGAEIEYSAGITATNATLKVGETATIKLDFDPASINAWFFAPCLVAENVTAITGLDFTITCKINGEDVAIDMNADENGKVWWTEDTGENKGNCIRLAGGYNEWATKYVAEPESVSSIEYTITLNGISGDPVDPVDPVDPTPSVEFDPNGTYNAYLLLQTPNWTYRNAWNDKTNGIDAETWGEALYGNETKQWYGKITDAVLAGNGTYSVEIVDFGTIFEDDFAAAGQDYFNILGFTSDAPLGGLTITNVKLIIDGRTIKTFDEAYQNPDDSEYVNILMQNIWNDDVKELPYYPAPTESLKIEFTVAGFSYDKATTGDDEGNNENNGGNNENNGTNNGQNSEKPADDGSNTGVIIAIVAVVVVAAAVVVVIVLKKKKN